MSIITHLQQAKGGWTLVLWHSSHRSGKVGKYLFKVRELLQWIVREFCLPCQREFYDFAKCEVHIHGYDNLLAIILSQSYKDLTRDLIRLPSKAKAQKASGQGSHWHMESPKFFHLHVTRPPEICVNLVFKHIHAASSYTICR